MTIIDNLTGDANQVTQVILEDGSVMTLTLMFMATTQRWIANISHTDLVLNGLNVCIDGNMLRDWRNLISFGLACTTKDGIDPFDIDDFSNGRATIYALSEDDVDAVEENLYGTVAA